MSFKVQVGPAQIAIHQGQTVLQAWHRCLIQVWVSSDIEKLVPKSIIEENSPKASAVTYSNKIFIVHGCDEGPREAVSNVLKSLGSVPIFLNQLP